MAVDELEIEEPNEEQAVSKGFYITRKLCILVSVVLVVTFIGLIAGISVVSSKTCASTSLLGKIDFFKTIFILLIIIIIIGSNEATTTLAPVTTTTTTALAPVTTTTTTALAPVTTTTTTTLAPVGTTTTTTLAPVGTTTTTTTVIVTIPDTSETITETIPDTTTTRTTTTTTTTTDIVTIPDTSETITETIPGTTTTTTTATVTTDVYRLPKSLKPYRYELEIAPVFDVYTEPDTFTGVVKIYFTCFANTDFVALHKKFIEIAEDKIIILQVTSSESINVLNLDYDNKTEIMKLRLAKTLQAGQNYSLSMHYEGELRANNFGFYKSFYTDSNKDKRWLIASQMEPVAARNAFPCFDEPAMKATFKLTVVHHENLTAFSNMPGTTVGM